MVPFALRLPVAGAVALAAVACGAAPAPPPDSGIRGRVLIGPTCPVEQVGNPCPDRPYRARIVIRASGSSQRVATVRSGSDGRFTVRLAPGRYVLVPSALSPGPLPRATPLAVTVGPHRFLHVVVRFDSGIR